MIRLDLDLFQNKINKYIFKLMTSYRQTGPNVYDYDRGSYDHYSSPQHTTVHTNQPVHTNEVVYTNAEHRETRPVVTTSQTELRQSHANRRGSRFEDYRRKAKDYKYNFFSLIDEPWNRCCEVGKCGTCPANECIAKK